MSVMEVSEEAVRTKLRTENPEYQQCEQEHHRLEATLAIITAHPYLSPEEEMEKKRIQKMKLALKDKMMDIIRRSKTGQA